MAKKKSVEVQGIEIANPLYDAVFKCLMDNNRVASYFVETLIEEKVEDITLLTSELPTFKWSKKYEKLNLTPDELERLKKLTVNRLDFVATIKTDSDEYKKVLIEIQKARNNTDVWRFRDYLAEHYKRRDYNKKKSSTQKEPLPIITIYLLGFNLQETDEVVINVKRCLFSGVTKKELKLRIPFADYLTHDSHIVQLGRITGKMQTRVEKVLSVFEQRYFIDDETKISKKYPHKTDDKIVNLMLEILEHACSDSEQRKKIETEWLSYEILNSMVLDSKKTIAAKNREIATKNKKIAKLSDNVEVLTKDNAAKDKRIAKLERQLKQQKAKDTS